MKEFTITKNDAGQRLDRFITKAAPLLSTGLIQKYIRKKRVKVNGRAADRDYRLLEGDVLNLYINDEFFDTPREDAAYLSISKPRLDIVYEDGNIVLLDKKPGILCHSAEGEPHSSTLIANLQAYLYQNRQWRPGEENSFAPALCNRIDRNTGGIVIAAKNAESLRIINDKIRGREIDKYYLCVCFGRLVPESGVLEGYIFKDAAKNQVYVRKTPEKGAKRAITRYKTIKSSGGLSLLECELITGRTHQIRAQLAAAGHPLLGDGKYGSERQNSPYGERHQALYSYRLRFEFKTSAGILDYLNGLEFKAAQVAFVEKYFNCVKSY